jgi:hypothetical protein
MILTENKLEKFIKMTHAVKKSNYLVEIKSQCTWLIEIKNTYA